MTKMKAYPLGWKVVVPAGTYFLGDPCYAVPDALWSDLLTSCDYFEGSPVGTVEGHEVLGFGTAHGDGCYRDRNGGKYPVDAGMIGLTPEALATKYPKEKLETLGKWVTFPNGAVCTAQDGLLEFGRITIDTRDEGD